MKLLLICGSCCFFVTVAMSAASGERSEVDETSGEESADAVLGETAKRHVHPTRKNRLVESLSENPPGEDSDIGKLLYTSEAAKEVDDNVASPEKAIQMPKLPGFAGASTDSKRKVSERETTKTAVGGEEADFEAKVTKSKDKKEKRKKNRTSSSPRGGASQRGMTKGDPEGTKPEMATTKAGIVKGFLNLFKSKTTEPPKDE